MAAWQFQAMADGRRPALQHDCTPWPENSPLAEERPFSYKGALIWIKGDWSVHAKNLGLSQWGSVFNPCQLCDCSLDDMH
eukprot:3005103-Pyramimonas_sp.AAC.1